ncbi:MAG: response regulator [Xanthomonadales bacterium]|nr:response regulator [Xanthomonadales bacterium]NIX11935.1 response regulator [Xanthomonadales bacterium]
MVTPEKTILIVEDEPKIAGLLADYLSAQGGFDTRIVDRGDRVLEDFRNDPPDLVLLDLMLPGLDGIEVCKQLRAESDVPIIMVTARVEEIDRLLGLELGADDYICKPFSPREVVARVKAVLRRASRGPDSGNTPGVDFDESRFTASCNGQRLQLTRVEFALLKALAGQPGRVFSRDQLMNEMYADYRVVSDRAVDTHVKNLRQKLREACDGRDLIESVYGLGYRLEY